MTVPLTSVEAEVVALSNSLRAPREAYFAEPEPDPRQWPDLVDGAAVAPRPFATRLRQARIQTAATRPGLLRPARVVRAALSHAVWAAWGRLRTARAAAARLAVGSAAGLWSAQALGLVLCWMVWRQPRGNGHALARLLSAQLVRAPYTLPRWPEPESEAD